MIRNLNNEETANIYNTHLVEDFPKSEVKPLKKILDGVSEGKYECFAYEENNELLGYAYFIKSSVSDTYLLDYFAVIDGKRSSGIGSKFLQGLKDMVEERGGHLILEVENPKYAPEGPHRDYMIKRIGFYEKNGLKLSGVSCTFYGNEYRIFYAGKDATIDEAIQAETEVVYKDFFGEKFIQQNCQFHPIDNSCKF